MSFGWTVVSTQPAHEPWKNERFHGYFTDIRRAARRSLPKKPSKELCNLLGLTLLPTELENQNLYSSSSVLDLDPEVGNLEPERRPVILTADRIPDVGQARMKLKRTTTQSKSDDSSRCTFREKTLCAVALYLAFMLALLLIIVLVLTLNATSSDNSDPEPLVILTTSRPRQTSAAISTKEPTPSSSLSATPTPSPKPSIKNGTVTMSKHNTTVFQTTPSSNGSSGISTGFSPNTTPMPSTSTPLQTVFSAVPNTTPGANKALTSTTSPASVNVPGSGGSTNVSSSCLTQACIVANGSMSRTDIQTSPCDDFYQHACGNWFTEAHGPSPTNRQDEFRLSLLEEIKDLLEQEPLPTASQESLLVKRIYRLCRETTNTSNMASGISDLREALAPLGLMEGGVFSRDVAEMLRLADRMYDVPVLFGTSLARMDQDGRAVYSIQIDPPRWSVIPLNYKTPMADDLIYRNATTHLLLMYLDPPVSPSPTTAPSANVSNSSKLGPDWLHQKVQEVFYLESIIFSLATESFEKLTSSESVATINDLVDLYPTLTSLGAFSSLLDFHGNTTVIVHHSDYFHALESLLEDPNIESVKWLVFIRVMLERVLKSLQLDFREMFLTSLISQGVVDIDLTCVEMMLELVSEDIHGMFVTANTQRVLSNRLHMLDMKNTLVLAFRNMLVDTAWIQPDIALALDVLLRKVEIQYSSMVSFLKGINIQNQNNRTLLSLSLEIIQLTQAKKYDQVGSNVIDYISKEWTDLEPRYDGQRKKLEMPTGLTVYLHHFEHLSHLYGYLGNLMAEALLDILVDEATEQTDPRWGAGTQSGFESVQQCFRNQSSYAQSQSPTSLQTLLRSNGALQLITKVFNQAPVASETYTLYGIEVTEEMLLYINSAQLHCTKDDGSADVLAIKHRVNDVIKNNVNMERVFGCPLDSSMIISETCSLLAT